MFVLRHSFAFLRGDMTRDCIGRGHTRNMHRSRFPRLRCNCAAAISRSSLEGGLERGLIAQRISPFRSRRRPSVNYGLLCPCLVREGGRARRPLHAREEERRTKECDTQRRFRRRGRRRLKSEINARRLRPLNQLPSSGRRMNLQENILRGESNLQPSPHHCLSLLPAYQL